MTQNTLRRQIQSNVQSMFRQALMANDPHCSQCSCELRSEAGHDNSAFLAGDVLKCQRCVNPLLKPVNWDRIRNHFDEPEEPPKPVQKVEPVPVSQTVATVATVTEPVPVQPKPERPKQRLPRWREHVPATCCSQCAADIPPTNHKGLCGDCLFKGRQARKKARMAVVTVRADGSHVYALPDGVTSAELLEQVGIANCPMCGEEIHVDAIGCWRHSTILLMRAIRSSPVEV